MMMNANDEKVLFTALHIPSIYDAAVSKSKQLDENRFLRFATLALHLRVLFKRFSSYIYQ